MSWHLLSGSSVVALTGLGRPLLRPYGYLVSTIAEEYLRHDIRMSIPLEVFRLHDTLPPRIPMSSDASLDTQLAMPHLESSMRKRTNERVDIAKVQEHNNQLHGPSTDLKEDYRQLTTKREEAQRQLAKHAEAQVAHYTHCYSHYHFVNEILKT
ncbi:hypothetical protein ACE6H2_006080 [Prunus campanulata]